MKGLRFTVIQSCLILLLSACSKQDFEFKNSAMEKNEVPCINGCLVDEDPEDPVDPPSMLYSYDVVIPNERQVDILIVDDNSQSMVEEQENISQRFPNFIAGLAGVEWQIGITTTDVSSSGARGHLLNYIGTNLKVITPTTPNAEQLFRDTVRIPYVGSQNERGIFAANLAVDLNENSWLRPNAHFAVIVLTDEDEYSNGTNLQTYDQPSFFISNVQNKLGSLKSFSFHSIITRPGDQVCLNGAGQSYGNTYNTLSQMTGSVVGDICSSDYGAELGDITGNIQNSLDSQTLHCNPINGDVQVEISPTPPTPIGHSLNGDKLTFTPGVPGGSTISLEYRCPIQ